MLIAFVLASLLWRPPAEPECVRRGWLPDSACSPGAIETQDLRIICGQPTRARRRVSEATKRMVLARYGVRWEDRGGYEIDHLVPIECGGGEDEWNLWPEPLAEARQKDLVENAAHRRVCAGTELVEEAQVTFASDWTKEKGR